MWHGRKDFVEAGVEFCDFPVAPAWPSETLEMLPQQPLNLSSSDTSPPPCLLWVMFTPALWIFLFSLSLPSRNDYRDNFWSHLSLLAQWDSARLYPGPGKAAESFSLAHVQPWCGVFLLGLTGCVSQISWWKLIMQSAHYILGILSKELQSSWSQQCLGIASFGVKGAGEEGLFIHTGDLGGGVKVVGFCCCLCLFFLFKETNWCYSVFSSSSHYQHSYYNVLRLLFALKSWESGISVLFNNVTFTRVSGLWISASLWADIKQSPHFRITHSRKQLRFGCLTHLGTWTSYQYRIIPKVCLTSSAPLNNSGSGAAIQ